MLTETTPVTLIAPLAREPEADSVESPAGEMDGDPVSGADRCGKAHEVGRPYAPPPIARPSLTDLVEMLAAMREADWVKGTLSYPEPAPADSAEIPTPTTNMGTDPR